METIVVVATAVVVIVVVGQVGSVRMTISVIIVVAVIIKGGPVHGGLELAVQVGNGLLLWKRAVMQPLLQSARLVHLHSINAFGG